MKTKILNWRRHPFKKHTVLIIAVISILILSWVSKGLYQWLVKPKASEEITVQAQTVQVKAVSMPEVIETVGTLSAVKELKIKSSGIGRIQRIYVPSGSWVRENTLLLNIVGAPDVKAPFDGYLTDWQVKLGEYVSAGTDLVDLVNTDQLTITYRVPEQYAGKLDIGQAVEVSVKAFPEKLFKGTVGFISPVVDKKTYTILIKANVQNTDQTLWPGMSAHVRQILVMHPNALVVPESALMMTLEGYEVFVVADGKIQRRTITLGEREEGRAHVISGVSLGDSVVMTRNDAIKEGAKAKANDWQGTW